MKEVAAIVLQSDGILKDERPLVRLRDMGDHIPLTTCSWYLPCLWADWMYIPSMFL